MLHEDDVFIELIDNLELNRLGQSTCCIRQTPLVIPFSHVTLCGAVI